MQPVERLLGNGPTREKEFFLRLPRSESLPPSSQIVRRDVHRVGDDREVLKVSEGAGDTSRCCAGIKDDHCPSATMRAARRQSATSPCDAASLSLVEWVFQGVACRQCPAMGAVNALAHGGFPGLADGDLEVWNCWPSHDQDRPSRRSNSRIALCRSSLSIQEL